LSRARARPDASILERARRDLLRCRLQMSREAASSSKIDAGERSSDDAQVHTTGARPRSALTFDVLEDDAPPESRSALASPSSSTPRPPPVLASQCLRDDVAPLEPWTRPLRRISAASAAVMSLAAAMFAARASFAAAAVALIAAAPVAQAALAETYPARGRAALVGGALAITSAALLSPSIGAASIALLTAAGCGAPLFFRAIYRASRGARLALAIALVVACAAAGLGLAHEGHPIARALAAAGLGVAGLGALGFMGEETTGGCAASGAMALVVSAGAVFAIALAHGASPVFAAGLGLLGGAGATVASLGAVQLAATRFGPSLRARVDGRGRLRAARDR
jgi:hypothetical protein